MPLMCKDVEGYTLEAVYTGIIFFSGARISRMSYKATATGISEYGLQQRQGQRQRHETLLFSSKDLLCGYVQHSNNVTSASGCTTQYVTYSR